MSYKWIKVQTHVHTINSDGLDTLISMAEAAEKSGIDVILLTDHNTMYGYKDIEDIYKKTGVIVIKAIEYTTFYGHVITVGVPYFRWEDLKKDSLNELADHVHKYNGIIGISHPMALGDPVCTGGRYKFIDTDFSKIDFMEEWHGVQDNHNEWEKNKNFWEDKVSNGNVITTVYGGDFHKKEHFQECNAFNWIYIDELKNIEGQVIEAIRLGKVIMSRGPYFNMTVINDNKTYCMGSRIEVKENRKIKINIDTVNLDNVKINLINNFGEKISFDLKEKYIEIEWEKGLRWIRAEVLDEVETKVLAKGNPVYFN